MSTALAHIVSILGVSSMICLLVAIMLLLHLIQQAFDRAGVLWGLISVVYPPGTYYYCRRTWDDNHVKFKIITGLIVASVVLWLLAKVF